MSGFFKKGGVWVFALVLVRKYFVEVFLVFLRGWWWFGLGFLGKVWLGFWIEKVGVDGVFI